MKKLLLLFAFLLPLLAFSQEVVQEKQTPATGASAGNQYFSWWGMKANGYFIPPYGTNWTVNRQSPLEGQVFLRWSDTTWQAWHNGHQVTVGGSGGSSGAIYFKGLYFKGLGTLVSPITNNFDTLKTSKMWLVGIDPTTKGYRIDTTGGGSGGNTIYTGNGFLSSTRTIYGNGHNLTFNMARGIVGGGTRLILDSLTGVQSYAFDAAQNYGSELLQDSVSFQLSKVTSSEAYGIASDAGNQMGIGRQILSSGNLQHINFGTTRSYAKGIEIQEEIDSVGLRYRNHNSYKYADSLTLMPKQYIDAHSGTVAHAGNGLSLSGDTVILGGNIDRGTLITFTPNNNYLRIGDQPSGNGLYMTRGLDSSMQVSLEGGDKTGSIYGLFFGNTNGVAKMDVGNGAVERTITLDPTPSTGRMTVSDSEGKYLANAADGSSYLFTDSLGLVQVNMLGLPATILTGMAVTITGPTTAAIGSGTYQLNNLKYSYAGGTATIPAQDATLSRYTLLSIVTPGVITVTNGTLSGTPIQPIVPNGAVEVSMIEITPSAVTPGGGGKKTTGTVKQFSFVNTNGFSGSVANSTTTPALTLTQNTILPNVVAQTGLGTAGTDSVMVKDHTTHTMKAISGSYYGTGTNIYNSNGSLTGTRVVSLNTHLLEIVGTNAFYVHQDNAVYLQSNGSSNTASMGTGGDGSTPINWGLSLTSGGSAKSITATIGTSGIPVMDQIDNLGLVYAADYSANFTARSLIDKGYADSRYVNIATPQLTTSSTVGYIWTATNTSGNGSWQAAAGGGLTSSNFVFNETPSGSINSSNVTFTLANTPTSGTVVLYLNGLEQVPTTDYTISGSTITYIIPPQTGYTLKANYLK